MSFSSMYPKEKMPTGNSKGIRVRRTRQRAIEIAIAKALSTIGKGLRRKGISLAHLMRAGRNIRSELLEEEYGIKEKKD